MREKGERVCYVKEEKGEGEASDPNGIGLYNLTAGKSKFLKVHSPIIFKNMLMCFSYFHFGQRLLAYFLFLDLYFERKVEKCYSYIQ